VNVRDRTELSHKHRTSSGPLRAAVYPIGSVALGSFLVLVVSCGISSGVGMPLTLEYYPDAWCPWSFESLARLVTGIGQAVPARVRNCMHSIQNLETIARLWKDFWQDQHLSGTQRSRRLLVGKNVSLRLNG